MAIQARPSSMYQVEMEGLKKNHVRQITTDFMRQEIEDCAFLWKKKFRRYNYKLWINFEGFAPVYILVYTHTHTHSYRQYLISRTGARERIVLRVKVTFVKLLREPPDKRAYFMSSFDSPR